MEKLAHGAGAPAITVFAKEDKDLKARNEKLQERKVASRRGELEQDLSGLIESRKPFTWEGLNYTVRHLPLALSSMRSI
jgi:ATP-binding cassette subfamily G (WHITE) protein 2 (SNQ2)